MNKDNDNLVRVELHAHTAFSKDCLVAPKELVQACIKKGIHRIAITDHNEIEGAFVAKAYDPGRVIVSEEIETTRGELIGYFMTEWVPPHLEPMDAIERLRAQGAVISVPHPFDTVRGQHWTEAELLEIVPHIHAIETFNARCLSHKPNRLAADFARRHGLLETVGSDAHSRWEVGRAALEMPVFNDARGFLEALKDAQAHTQLSPAFVHLFSRYAVLIKKMKISN